MRQVDNEISFYATKRTNDGDGNITQFSPLIDDAVEVKFQPSYTNYKLFTSEDNHPTSNTEVNYWNYDAETLNQQNLLLKQEWIQEQIGGDFYTKNIMNKYRVSFRFPSPPSPFKDDFLTKFDILISLNVSDIDHANYHLGEEYKFMINKQITNPLENNPAIIHTSTDNLNLTNHNIAINELWGENPVLDLEIYSGIGSDDLTYN